MPGYGKPVTGKQIGYYRPHGHPAEGTRVSLTLRFLHINRCSINTQTQFVPRNVKGS